MYEEQEKFESDKQFFAERRAALENEKKQLTDAAVKLGHEVITKWKYNKQTKFL